MATPRVLRSPGHLPVLGGLRLTASGWVAVHLVPALAILALWLPSSACLTLAATLLLGLAASWPYGRAVLAPLRASWLPPPLIHAASDLTIGARLDAPLPRGPLSLVVQRGDGQPAALAGLGTVDHLGVRLAWTTRFPRRGPAPLPPLLVATTRPFGLLELRRVASRPARVLVLPAIGRMRRHAPQRLARMLDRGRRLRRGHSDEPHQLRAWRPGDGRSRIHWRASARRGDLLVMEREDPDEPQLVLLLDLRCASQRSRRLERLIAAAATLVDHADGLGWETRLHAAGLPPAGVSGRQAILEALAIVSARPVSDPDPVATLPGPGLLLCLDGAAHDHADGWIACGLDRLESLLALPRIHA